MKKSIILSMVLLAFFKLSAQQQQGTDEFQFLGKNPPMQKNEKFRLASSDTKNNAIGWLVPSWNLLDYFYMGTASVSHYANVIFPDSTVIYESGGVNNYNWLISAGGVLDPYSLMFDSLQIQQYVANGEGYYLDSVFVLGWYNRVNAGQDTLMLEIVHGQPLMLPEFANTVFNFPDDTFRVSPPKVIGSAVQQGFLCQMTAPGRTLIKYLLTNNDSTNHSGKYIVIPVGMLIPAGHVVGVNISFVPGQAYSFGDLGYSYSGTHVQTVNSFRIGLYSTDDVNIDPHIFAEPYGRYSASHYVRKQVRYHMYTGSNAWRNERMVSTMSWGFDLGYFISDTSYVTGINTPDKSSVSLWPNPCSGILNIETATTGASHIAVYGISGNLISESVEYGPRINKNMTAYPSGMYFIKIQNDKGCSTRKIILK